MKQLMKGFNENVATFACGETLRKGMLVKMAGNAEVEPCGAAGEPFCGVAASVRGGFAGVQLCGYAELPYTGADPEVGYQALAAADGTHVCVKEGGRQLLVVDVDSAAKTAGILL